MASTAPSPPCNPSPVPTPVSIPPRSLSFAELMPPPPPLRCRNLHVSSIIAVDSLLISSQQEPQIIQLGAFRKCELFPVPLLSSPPPSSPACLYLYNPSSGFEDMSQGQDSKKRSFSSPPRSQILDHHEELDSPTRKCECFKSITSDSQLTCKARKENNGVQSKAANWKVEVQEILASAITYYHSLLSSVNPYLDHLTEITWAKCTWQKGCKTNDMQIMYNLELLKLVCNISPLIFSLMTLQIYNCRSYLQGKVKATAKNIIKSTYKLWSTTNEKCLCKQQLLVESLKKKFTFLYHVCSLCF